MGAQFRVDCQSRSTQLSACRSPSLIYYKNYTRLELLRWKSLFSLMPIAVENWQVSRAGISPSQIIDLAVLVHLFWQLHIFFFNETALGTHFLTVSSQTYHCMYEYRRPKFCHEEFEEWEKPKDALTWLCNQWIYRVRLKCENTFLSF